MRRLRLPDDWIPEIKKRAARLLRLRSSFLPEENQLIVLAIAVGVLTGFGSVGFIKVLHAVTDFARNRVAAGLGFVFGPADIVLLPALGGLIVGPIIYHFAREARGHGVPEVMTALATAGGRIRPRVVLVKIAASATTIGFGGTAGREGPMIQIGSAIGSAIGQLSRLPTRHIRTLVACGAAGGVAATFNAPIAGAIFSMEVLMGRLAGDFLLVLLTSLTSTFVARAYLGNYPAFVAPAYELVSPAELPLYFGLGLIAGLAALLYVRLLYRSEDWFEAWQFPEWLKPAVGGLMVGVLLRYFPEVYGAGFPAMEAALWVRLSWGLLIGLFFAELLGNIFTLGSGGSGGVFAPSLFMGAMLGGAYRNRSPRALPGGDRRFRCLRHGRDGRVLRGRGQGAHDVDPDPLRDDERLPDHPAPHGRHRCKRHAFQPLHGPQHLHAEAATAGHHLPLRRAAPGAEGGAKAGATARAAPSCPRGELAGGGLVPST